ncbi:metallophosphoesterase [Mesorhizobium sp. M0494]|uniref:metallophosphoesterase family protein n=1 Tax=Mesorhizobium sp. M0494 TaxID=2956951 RepID=UPI00333B53EB
MTSFLIVSDTHAFLPSSTSGKPSLLEASHAGRTNVIRAIAKLLEEEELKPDWILCPGDLGDKASPEGQAFVWSELNSLKAGVKARFLLGAAGNHDLDSRFANSAFDPKANIKALVPPFPGITVEDCDKYWSRHYSIHYDGACRIVNLNSSAFHGYGKESGAPKEFEHGRVAEATILGIVDEVKSKESTVNVLLTHHHIISNEHIYADEYSEMRGGSRLMHRLTDATKSSWIVIHGHLHYPELDYGRGSALAPVVLSAGSASAHHYGGSSESPPNQIYLLKLADDGKTALDGWGPCGTISAWYWSPDGRWERSPSRHKVPYGTGFGTRLNPKQAADRFETVLASSGQPYVYFHEAFEIDPLLKYLLPADLDLAVRELVRRNLKVTTGDMRADSLLRRV